MTIKTLVYCALFGTLAFISTTFLKIPISFGFIHFGDTTLFLLLITFRKKFFSPFISFAFFMGMSDLYLGYPNYIATTIITRILLTIVLHSFNKIIFEQLMWIIIPLNYFFTDLVLFNLSLALSYIGFNFLQISIPLILITQKQLYWLIIFLKKKTNYKGFNLFSQNKLV